MEPKPIITWSPELETGHAEIDAQHKTLVEALTRLHQAIQAGQGEEELGWCLSFLKAYSRVHFRTEEALLRSAGLDSPSHRASHADFLKGVDQLFTRYIHQELGVVEDTARLLGHWLRHHILTDDQVLVDLPERPKA